VRELRGLSHDALDLGDTTLLPGFLDAHTHMTILPGEGDQHSQLHPPFGKWRRDGRPRRAHDRLRTAVRQTEGRDPSGTVIDSQAVKGTGVGGAERGNDGAKRLSRAGNAICSWTPPADSS
jgi:imidazolonepropionase-like amidohydrolase